MLLFYFFRFMFEKCTEKQFFFLMSLFSSDAKHICLRPSQVGGNNGVDHNALLEDTSAGVISENSMSKWVNKQESVLDGYCFCIKLSLFLLKSQWIQLYSMMKVGEFILSFVCSFWLPALTFEKKSHSFRNLKSEKYWDKFSIPLYAQGQFAKWNRQELLNYVIKESNFPQMGKRDYNSSLL